MGNNFSQHSGINIPKCESFSYLFNYGFFESIFNNIHRIILN